MNAIEWIDTQISGLETEIGVLKMQRKVLIDAQKNQKLDELAAALAPKAAKSEEWDSLTKTARKPRTSGVKDMVTEIIHQHAGIKTGDIISQLPDVESGSIRQALNGLKKKGEITQDGKMWVMTSEGDPGFSANGAYQQEEMTA